MPCATYRLPRSFVGRFRRQRRGLLLLPALPAGRGKFLRRDSPSCALRGLAACVAWLWSSTGPPFPTLPLNSPAHRSSSQPQQHRQQPLRSLSPKRKAPLEAPAKRLPPLPHRAGNRGWFLRRSLQEAVFARDGRERRPPPLPPTPCAVGCGPVRVSPRGPAGPPRTPCNLGLCRLLRIHQIRPGLSLLHRQLARSLYPGVSLRRRIDATMGPHVKETPGTLLPPGD